MPTPAPVGTAPALTLRLFGPSVLLADGTAVRTHSARTFALLAYLALEPERPHARDTLVDLLWPDLPLASGRQSLRQALYSLRAVAGGRLGGCLQVDARSVQFLAPDQGLLDIDVHRFLTAVRSADNADWRAAAALHRAPLLDGMAAVPGPTSDAWLQAARDRFGALALQNLGRLVTGHMAQAEWDAAARHAQAMVALDATSEVASQYLLRIFAAQGLAQAVDAEWARLCAQLSQGLGVAPSAESAALHAAVRRQGATPEGSSPSRAATPVDAAPAGAHAAGARDAEAMVWAAQAAERVFAYNHAADLYDRALRVMARGAPATAQQVDVLMRREAVLERLGRRADQALVIDDAMAMAQALGDPARVAVVCLRRAGVCAYLRRHDEARAAAERALQIFRDLGDAPGEAEALQRTREALDLHRRIGDATGEATALHNQAEVHRGLGSPRQGCQLFEQATRLHWATDNPAGEILSLFGWAQALRQAGDLPGSAEKLQAALKLTDLRGERVMQSRVLHALAMLHAADGALDAAVDQMRRVIEIDRAIGYGHALGHDLIDLSNLHLQAGEVSQARVALLEAMVWFGFADDDDAIASTRSRLAVLEADGPAAVLAMCTRGGVKSHLSLGEGKVYCEFESPLGQARLSVA
jgi:DNA-binding SARP family transcriptional activator